MFTEERVVSASTISSLGKMYRQHIFISSSVYKFNLNYTFVCHTTLLYRFPHFTLNSIQFNRVNVSFHPKYTHSRPFSLTIFQSITPTLPSTYMTLFSNFLFSYMGKLSLRKRALRRQFLSKP